MVHIHILHWRIVLAQGTPIYGKEAHLASSGTGILQSVRRGVHGNRAWCRWFVVVKHLAHSSFTPPTRQLYSGSLIEGTWISLFAHLQNEVFSGFCSLVTLRCKFAPLIRNLRLGEFKPLLYNPNLTGLSLNLLKRAREAAPRPLNLVAWGDEDRP